jgi:hypothetical protein
MMNQEPVFLRLPDGASLIVDTPAIPGSGSPESGVTSQPRGVGARK